MDDFARLPPTDRASVFAEAANQMGIAEQFVAKDFWVCWTLDKLFALPEDRIASDFQGRHFALEGVRDHRAVLRRH